MGQFVSFVVGLVLTGLGTHNLLQEDIKYSVDRAARPWNAIIGLGLLAAGVSLLLAMSR